MFPQLSAVSRFLKSREFYKLSKELLGPILEPHGFRNDGSKRSVFYRQVSDDLFHCIVPWLKGRRGTHFAINILATSPLIDLYFDEKFPDELGMPLDRKTSLDPKDGVTFQLGHGFRGNKKEGFIRNFNTQAKPAIIKYGIPHLDKITSLKKLRRHMTPPNLPGASLSYALVHWHTGKKREARKLLLEHRNYLLASIAKQKSLEPVAKADLKLHQSSLTHYAFAIAHIEKILDP